MKLYIVKYSANEYDDLGYDSPYPIYYSLNRDNAYKKFSELVNYSRNSLNQFLKEHPNFQNNEDYSIETDNENEFEYSFGKWFYKYIFVEVEMEVDLRYKN